MKKALSLLVAVLFLTAFSPLALAQEEGEEATETEETTTKEGEADDPWSVPEAAEKAEEDKKAEEAEAAEPEIVAPTGYPIAEIDRPLALPKMTLEPRAQFAFDIVEPDNWISIRIGTGFGITNEIEAGLMFPLSFAPEFRAGDLLLYGMYELGQFLDNTLRAAGRLKMHIPMSDIYPSWPGAAFVVLADAPVKFKFHDMFAAVGGVGLGFMIGKEYTVGNITVEGPNLFLLNIDAGILVQPMEPLALSLTMGIHNFLGDNSDTFLPLTFGAQYTLMGDLDVYLDFGFRDLIDLGADWISLIIGAAYRLGL